MTEKIKLDARTTINQGELVRVFINKLNLEQAKVGLSKLLKDSKLSRVGTEETYIFNPAVEGGLSRTIKLYLSHDPRSIGSFEGNKGYTVDHILKFLNHPVYFGNKLLNAWLSESLRNQLKIDSISYSFRLHEPNFPTLMEDIKDKSRIDQLLDERLPKWFNTMAKTHIRAMESQASFVQFKDENNVLFTYNEGERDVLKEKRTSITTNTKKRDEDNFFLFAEFEATRSFDINLKELYRLIFNQYLGINENSITTKIPEDLDIEVSIDIYGFNALKVISENK